MEGAGQSTSNDPTRSRGVAPCPAGILGRDDQDRVGVTVGCGVLVGVDSGVAVLAVNGKLDTSCQ